MSAIQPYSVHLKSLLSSTLQQMLVYRHRYHSRKVLAQLDERMLADIGISKVQAEKEAELPFWKGETSVFDTKVYEKVTRKPFVKTAKCRGVY